MNKPGKEVGHLAICFAVTFLTVLQLKQDLLKTEFKAEGHHTILKDFFKRLLGLNKFIFFVNYFYLQNKLFMLMAMFS